MARERPPSRPALDPEVRLLPSGAVLRKLGGCPGYIDPWPRRSKPTVRSDSAPDRAHKIAIGDSDLTNVRFGSLCGLKSDISRGPRSASRRHHAQLAAPRKIDGKATDEFAAVKPARDTPAFDKLDDVG